MQMIKKIMAGFGFVVAVQSVLFVGTAFLYGAGLSEQEKFLKTLEAIMQKGAFDPDKDAAILKSFIQDSGASVANLFSQVDAQVLFNTFERAATITFIEHGIQSNFMAWLLDNDPVFKDINVKQQVTGKTLLIYAVEFNETNLVTLLLARPGIDISIKDNTHKTALEYAESLSKDPAIIQALKQAEDRAKKKNMSSLTKALSALKAKLSELAGKLHSMK